MPTDPETERIQKAFLHWLRPGDTVLQGLDNEFRGTDERPDGVVLHVGQMVRQDTIEVPYAIVQYRGIDAPQCVFQGGEKNLQPDDATFRVMVNRKEEHGKPGFRGVEKTLNDELQEVKSIAIRALGLQQALAETTAAGFRGICSDIQMGDGRFSQILLQQFTEATTSARPVAQPLSPRAPSVVNA